MDVKANEFLSSSAPVSHADNADLSIKSDSRCQGSTQSSVIYLPYSLVIGQISNMPTSFIHIGKNQIQWPLITDCKQLIIGNSSKEGPPSALANLLFQTPYFPKIF